MINPVGSTFSRVKRKLFNKTINGNKILKVNVCYYQIYRSTLKLLLCSTWTGEYWRKHCYQAQSFNHSLGHSSVVSDLSSVAIQSFSHSIVTRYSFFK